MQVTSAGVRRIALIMVTGPGGPLETVRAHPLKSPISASDQTGWDQVVPLLADFTGSEFKLIVWGPLAIAANRQPFKESQLLMWVADAAPETPQTIYGIAYSDASVSPVLLGVDLFPEPVLISDHWDSVQWIATAP